MAEPPAEQRTTIDVSTQVYGIVLAIFDLDGTLTGTRSGETFPRDLYDRVPLPHTEQKIAKLHEEGVGVAIATNQGGIAHGYYDPVTLWASICASVEVWYGIRNQNVIMCPHHPQGTVREFARECACRKPSPYMLLTLMDRYHIAPSRTLFVGDMESDREAAERAGCHFMWSRDYFSPREWH